MAVPYIPGAMVDVVRLRYPIVEDEYRNKVLGDVPERKVIQGCCFQPSTGQETLIDADRFTARGDIYLPLPLDEDDDKVSGLDQIEVPGYGVFHILGPLETWPDVAGLGHSHATLVRYKES